MNHARGIHKGCVSKFQPKMRSIEFKAEMREGEAENDWSVNLIDKMGPVKLISK